MESQFHTRWATLSQRLVHSNHHLMTFWRKISRNWRSSIYWWVLWHYKSSGWNAQQRFGFAIPSRRILHTACHAGLLVILLPNAHCGLWNSVIGKAAKLHGSRQTHMTSVQAALNFLKKNAVEHHMEKQLQLKLHTQEKCLTYCLMLCALYEVSGFCFEVWERKSLILSPGHALFILRSSSC